MEQTQIIIAENGNTELESTFNYPVPCIAGIEPEHLETANFLLAYSRILLKSNDLNMILAEKERLQQEDKGLIGLKGFNAFFEAVIQEQSHLIAAVNQQEPLQQIEETAFKKKSLWEKLKNLVPHGEWGEWLKEKVKFSQWTATKFMKVAEEWTDSAALTNLNQTNVLALLDIPQDQRQDFIESNPINEMTTRHLQEAIKGIEVAPADYRSRENQ